jgi:hypothetical protein
MGARGGVQRVTGQTKAPPGALCACLRPGEHALIVERVWTAAMLGAAHHTVSVGALAVHTADAGYSAVSSLVADLPSHPADDRQRVALQTLHALRQRVLRLLALARWLPHSQTALQLLRVRDVLTQRDAAYHDAATRLMEAHYTVSAEPLYNVPLALQVLSAQTAGASALVPASVAELRPPPPLAQHPERLDAAVRVRLLRATRPELLHVAHVAGGLATLRVAHEFEADVTAGPTRTEGDAPTSLGGWVVVRVRLLVCEADAPASAHLGHPQHRMLVWELNKRMAASTEPLCVLYTCMHDLSVMIARDIAGRQAKSLAAGRWASAIRLAPLPGVPPPPGFGLHYWQQRLSLLVKLNDAGQLICGHVPPLDDNRAGDVSASDEDVQLVPSKLCMERLLLASIAAASWQRLRACQMALALRSETAPVRARVRKGANAGDPPELAIQLPGVDSMPGAALFCDLHTGQLRLRGVAAVLTPTALRDLETAAGKAASAAEGGDAVLMVTDLWRAAVAESLTQHARTHGMRVIPSAGNQHKFIAASSQQDLVLVHLAPTRVATLRLPPGCAPTAEHVTVTLLHDGASEPAPLDVSHARTSWEDLVTALAAHRAA